MATHLWLGDHGVLLDLAPLAQQVNDPARVRAQRADEFVLAQFWPRGHGRGGPFRKALLHDALVGL